MAAFVLSTRIMATRQTWPLLPWNLHFAGGKGRSRKEREKSSITQWQVAPLGQVVQEDPEGGKKAAV
jgi:hypothetical protein